MKPGRRIQIVTAIVSLVGAFVFALSAGSFIGTVRQMTHRPDTPSVSHVITTAAHSPSCTSNWLHKYGTHRHNGAVRPFAWVYWTENTCGDEARIKLEWWQSGTVLGRRAGPWRTGHLVKSEVDGAANTSVADAWAQWRACTNCKIHTTQIADRDDGFIVHTKILAYSKRTSGSLSETNGTYYVGSPAGGHSGDAAVEVDPPGKSVIWTENCTFNGKPCGYLRWASNNNFIAATNDCTNATTKTDPGSNGVVMVLTLDGNGNFVWSSRYCDQQTSGDINTFLAGRGNGTQFVICSTEGLLNHACSGLYRAIWFN